MIVFAVTLAIVTYIDRVCISIAAPAISETFQLTPKQMGWVFLIFSWSYAAFEIPGGFLGDRIGPRKVLTRIVVWWSFFTAATGWAWNYVSLLVTRFMFGAGEAGCFPNLTKVFTIWLPAKERTRAQAITWLSARWGGAFTPPLVAAVMAWLSPDDVPAHGWRQAFQVFGAVGVVWAVIFWWWFRDDPFQNKSMNEAEKELIRSDGAVSVSSHVHVPWSKLVASKQVWMLCWQYFCLSYGWYFYVTWLPTYLKEARGLTFTNTALLSVLPLFAGGIGNPVSMWLGYGLRRVTTLAVSRRIISCLGFAGASGFLVLSTRFDDPTWAVGAIALASFCNDLVMPHAWASAMDIGGKYAGTLSGAMNFWGNVGGGLGPLMIGYILSWTNNNWNLTFYVSAAIYLAGTIFWLLLDPVTPLDEQPA